MYLFSTLCLFKRGYNLFFSITVDGSCQNFSSIPVSLFNTIYPLPRPQFHSLIVIYSLPLSLCLSLSLSFTHSHDGYSSKAVYLKVKQNPKSVGGTLGKTYYIRLISTHATCLHLFFKFTSCSSQFFFIYKLFVL